MKLPYQEILSELLNIKVIQVRTESPFFRWTSGLYSPIYCDSRLVISFPELRSNLTRALVGLVRNKFYGVELIAGVATSGIVQAALIANTLNLPMIYVRPKAKNHGMRNQIEGKITPYQKVLLIEDVISTGKSAIQASKILKEKKIELLGVLATFSYDFNITRHNLREENLHCEFLIDYAALLEFLKKQNYISFTQEQILKKWKNNPSTWNGV